MACKENSSEVDSASESDYVSTLSDSDTSIEICFNHSLPAISSECTGHHGNHEQPGPEEESPLSSPAPATRFPRVRRASCPVIMVRDKEHLQYLVAGSRNLPEPVISKAYRSLLDHTKPILLPHEPKSNRLLSYYDYVPSRKVYNEQDQYVRDRNREDLKIELLVEERRKQYEAMALERELLGEDYEEEDKEEEDEDELKDIMTRRRMRRLKASDNTFQGLFPNMDHYDFGHHEKDRQKQAHLSNGHKTKGRRGSDPRLRRGSKHRGSNGDAGAASEPKLERRNSKRGSLGDEPNQPAQTHLARRPSQSGPRLERRGTKMKLNTLNSVPPTTKSSSDKETPPTDTKFETNEIKLQVLSAMKLQLPQLRRTSTSTVQGSSIKPLQMDLLMQTTPQRPKQNYKLKRSISVGNPPKSLMDENKGSKNTMPLMS